MGECRRNTGRISAARNRMQEHHHIPPPQTTLPVYRSADFRKIGIFNSGLNGELRSLMRGRETKSLGEKRKEEVVGKSDVGRLVSRLVGQTDGLNRQTV